MPSLEFKGKSFVYAPHLSVRFRELVEDGKKPVPPTSRGVGGEPSLDDNLIIRGERGCARRAGRTVITPKQPVICRDI